MASLLARCLLLAEITSHLHGNPDDKAVILLMNQNYLETARAIPDCASAVKGLIKEMGLTTGDMEDPDGFGQAISEKHEAGKWKGLLMVEADLITRKAEILDLDALDFDMVDFL